jgi:hypothetical protein
MKRNKAHFMLKLTVFELETWFLVWRDVFDQHEDGSTHFLIFVLFHIRFLPFLKALKTKIAGFWARDLIFCVKGCFWPLWRWVNSFFDFCPIWHTFLTFFESPKKLKLPVFEVETWFFLWRDVFDQHEHVSTHFLNSALLRSKIALLSWVI